MLWQPEDMWCSYEKVHPEEQYVVCRVRGSYGSIQSISGYPTSMINSRQNRESFERTTGRKVLQAMSRKPGGGLEAFKFRQRPPHYTHSLSAMSALLSWPSRKRSRKRSKGNDERWGGLGKKSDRNR